MQVNTCPSHWSPDCDFLGLDWSELMLSGFPLPQSPIHSKHASTDHFLSHAAPYITGLSTAPHSTQSNVFLCHGIIFHPPQNYDSGDNATSLKEIWLELSGTCRNMIHLFYRNKFFHIAALEISWGKFFRLVEVIFRLGGTRELKVNILHCRWECDWWYHWKTS